MHISGPQTGHYFVRGELSLHSYCDVWSDLVAIRRVCELCGTIVV